MTIKGNNQRLSRQSFLAGTRRPQSIAASVSHSFQHLSRPNDCPSEKLELKRGAYELLDHSFIAVSPHGTAPRYGKHLNGVGRRTYTMATSD